MTDPASNVLTSALDELRALLGERLSTAPAVRERHGKDETYHPGASPDAVAFAHTTDEVARIVGICAAHRLGIRHKQNRIHHLRPVTLLLVPDRC